MLNPLAKTVNDLRISPGVLPTSAFMRYIPKAGTSLIVR